MTLSSDDLQALLIESVADYAIFMLDCNGYIVSWNTGAARIKGHTAHQIIGRHFSCFYPEPDRQAGVPDAALRTAEQTGRFTAEGWRLRKDGSRFWAMVVIAPIRQDGKLVGFAKITRDITEQHMAALAARESDQRFRLLVQGVSDYAIFMLDLEGRVTNWNAGAQRIKGYSEAEIVGRHFSAFYIEEDRANGAPARTLEVARRDGRYEAEAWRVRKDGTRFWAGVVVDAIRDEAAELIGFAKITRDLTERREAQLQLERSRQQFFEAQKMEAVGQLTGGMAHDFNNLLTGILGCLELGRTRLSQRRTEDADRHLAAAQSAGMRAAALTSRLLAFARRQTLDPRPTDANTLVAGILDLIQRTVGAGIHVETVAAAGLWQALCDPNQLENALLNLCITHATRCPRADG
ncbi:MAG: PAS domain S-box protein [Rhodopila sp.]